jgi:hypothetical protein
VQPDLPVDPVDEPSVNPPAEPEILRQQRERFERSLDETVNGLCRKNEERQVHHWIIQQGNVTGDKQRFADKVRVASEILMCLSEYLAGREECAEKYRAAESQE